MVKEKEQYSQESEKGKNAEKMAFLISAYTEPLSLYALVKKLDGMLDADFYIHIDKKVQIAPFQSGLINMANVYFVEKRIRVYWGGYSQVEMQMAMINEMLSKNTQYTRVIHLTGTDYPIVEKEVLMEKLKNGQVEYICGFDINHEISTNKRKLAAKYACYYLMDSPRIIRAVTIRLRIPRLYYKNFKIPMYYGSEYWALTYDCIKDLYFGYIENKDLQKLLLHAFVPSESWIHTMFFNSKWKNKAVWPSRVERRGLINLSPVTYFKYGKTIKVLDESDYEDIIKSGRMFARKIITGKSDGLIDLLSDKCEKQMITAFE